jgi:hypothetical protein
MTRCLIGLLAGVALAVTLCGCEKGPPAGPPVGKPHPTHGKVAFPDGTPLKGGVVTFQPVEIKDGSRIRYAAAGLVDARGQYQVGLNGDGSGAVSGDYKVVIEPRDYQELPGSNSNRIPQKYRSAATTIIKTVKEGDNLIDILLD